MPMRRGSPCAFAAAGWPAPASWADLADTRFAGKVAIPGIDNTYGLVALLMYARQNGGGIDNIDPGFAYIAKSIAPNVRAFESSPGRMSELFQSGEVSLAVWGSGRVNALADTGFPIKFVYPKEGAAALLIAACVVNGAPHEATAQAFLDYLLSPAVQGLLAAAGNGPVNKKVTLAPELAARLPYGPEQVAKLVAFDSATHGPNAGIARSNAEAPEPVHAAVAVAAGARALRRAARGAARHDPCTERQSLRPDPRRDPGAVGGELCERAGRSVFPADLPAHATHRADHDGRGRTDRHAGSLDPGRDFIPVAVSAFLRHCLDVSRRLFARGDTNAARRRARW